LWTVGLIGRRTSAS
jgi:hypothetical protein